MNAGPTAAARAAALIAALALGAASSRGEDDLAERSLPLRTALHRDPTMLAPFQRLLALYREANRADDLVGTYRAHVARYPADAGATAVLVRLLLATRAPEAGSVARSGVERHPDDAYLRYLLYKLRSDDHEPGALDELDRAIDLETLPERKREWIGELLPAAIAEDSHDLVEKHLRSLRALAGDAPVARLEVAREMISLGFCRLALEVLRGAAEATPSPSPSPSAEVGVELEMAAASAEVGLNRKEEAAARLTRLLSRLTADYWRRPEILRRRVALAAPGPEREAMLDGARGRVGRRPHDETAVCDLARLLAAFERRREALEALLDGGRRLPASDRIEKETLELFDRLRDTRGREAYLAERMKAHPGRRDLGFRRAKSLFLLGRRKEALSLLDELMGEFEPTERVRHLLETARYLRRSSMPSVAAKLFRRVIELAPARLDVRRELAETYLAAGERPQARELFAGGLSREAESENLLDAVQFMVEQEMFVEARAALQARLKEEETNLELRLMLLEVFGRLGDRREGEALIARSRGVADTAARYRLWLESAVAFHDVFDAVEAFFEAERARLGGRAEADLDRKMAFADVAARNGCRAEAAAMIRDELAGELPLEVRFRLRRRLVEILEEDKAQAAAVEQQLKMLLRDDLARADEYRARLALLQHRQGREDLSRPLLGKIDLSAVRDPVLLGGLEALYKAQGNGRKVIEILDRLTVLDPTNRMNWQRWLTALAATGDESRLRAALRRLLAGVERMPIGDETRTLLWSHLVDSYWRSIARLLAEGLSAPRADALALLDSVERAARTRAEWLWVAWTRAYVLNRLGRYDARDEAVRELERVVEEERDSLAAEGAQDEGDSARTQPGIEFPDGLSLSLPRARGLLTATVTGVAHLPADFRKGPLPELGVRWAFDAYHPVTGLLPLDGRRVLVCDLSGGMHCLDAETGKLLWEKGALPVTSAGRPSPHHGGPAQTGAPPGPVTDGEGRIYASLGREVRCLSADDGRLLWRAEVAGRGGGGGTAFVSVFVREGRVLAFDPVRSAAACLDGVNGKLLWEKELPSGATGPVSWQNSGASLSGGRLLVYGACAAILDADTGEIEWSFEPTRVRRFPVRLEEASGSSAPLPPALFGAGGGPYALMGIRMRGPMRYRPQAQAQGAQYVSYLAQQMRTGLQQHAPYGGMALAAPAVVWASQPRGIQPRLGVLRGGRLLLFGQSKLSALHIDLPLAGKEIQGVHGVFVGVAGRIACVLQQGQLALLDVETGKTRHYALKELTNGQAKARLRAAVDGPLVYLTGPAGILCVNAMSNQRAFMVPWPKAVAPGQAPAPPQHVQYRWQGVSSYYGNRYGPCTPMADRVEEGVLYATVTPTRVAAIIERPAETDRRE